MAVGLEFESRKGKEVYLHHSVQSRFWGLPAFYQIVTGFISLVLKRPAREADHSIQLVLK
jgi:hypothetical protein